ncbi:hypothetical protein [Spiroplasma endosymbiont of Agriotes lineatus]|uniref:hypothetical protein n=1 Tax=Spiroplasma endosymbiont of Agriotes lineatus TaxID=3077930 RepID=UPI0030CB4683
MPILISGAVVSAIIMIGVYAIGGKVSLTPVATIAKKQLKKFRLIHLVYTY